MTDVSDHDKIRRLLAEYCLACDECRFDDFAALLGEDGVMRAFRRDWVGHDTLVGFISNAPEGIHINSAVRIDVDGDQAEVLSNFAFFTLDNEVGSLGTYADTVVRDGDRWRFARREIRMAKPHNPEST